MPLSIVLGPPNSGRAGVIAERFRSGLDRGPILVVPTADDAERFERELSATGGLLGGSVVTFGGLFGEVARALDLPWGGGASRAQRTWLAREAIRACKIGSIWSSANRAGFAPALAELIEELQAASIDPQSFATAAESATDYERHLARLHQAWVTARDSRRLADAHVQAAAVTAALRGRGAQDVWERRPVLIYGFDDLTGEQLDLVGALATAAQVTVAVTYEEGRPALEARARLLQELRAVVPEGELAGETKLEADSSTTPNALLWHLDRSFLIPQAPRREPDQGLLLLRSAGERAEAELVGAEIARLLADGAKADEIAVVLRNPNRHGSLWAEVFSRLGIPAAVDATVPLTCTATGRALAAAARAIGKDGVAADLIAYLRVPGRAPSGSVDWLERRVRREGVRSAADAERVWDGFPNSRELTDLARLRKAGSGAALLREAAALARDIAEWPLWRTAPGPGRHHSLELRAAAQAEGALLEVAALDPSALGPSELAQLLDAVGVALHTGPARGRVLLVSPYRLRARRVKHLFAASLQDGEFPRRGSGSPLLSDERRAGLGLPERSSPEQEERYLFSICLSRPEQSLALSWRESDSEGRASARSPFVDEVRDLLEPDSPEDPEAVDPLFTRIGRDRGPNEVVAPAGAASTPQDLARAIALTGRGQWDALLGAAVIPAPAAALVRALLTGAEAVTAPARLRPVNLSSGVVLAALAENDVYGASTLETYGECSYRWFVDHELRPERLEPKDEPLLLGGLAHQALELLYRERPGGTPRPTPVTLAAWRRRTEELVSEHAADFGLPPTDPLSFALIRRVEGLIWAYLTDEAAAEHALSPDPGLLEAKFGLDEDCEHPPLELDGLRLRGAIDRIDVGGPEGARVGLITDYKLSAKVTPAAKLREEGKLQLPLYSLAVRKLFGLDPVGGIYIPLRAGQGKARRPRGLLNGEHADLLGGFDLVDRDVLDSDEFAGALAQAEAAAAAIAAKIETGKIRRNPRDGKCPRYCRYQTICRKERGVPEPLELDEEEAFRL